jgi:hypothetical protein
MEILDRQINTKDGKGVGILGGYVFILVCLVVIQMTKINVFRENKRDTSLVSPQNCGRGD